MPQGRACILGLGAALTSINSKIIPRRMHTNTNKYKQHKQRHLVVMFDSDAQKVKNITENGDVYIKKMNMTLNVLMRQNETSFWSQTR